MKPQNVTKIRVVGGGVPIPGYSRLVVTENGGVCGVTFGKAAQLNYMLLSRAWDGLDCPNALVYC